MKTATKFVSENAIYLVLLGILAPLATITSYVFGLNAIFKGQSSSIVVSFVIFGLSLVLWLFYGQKTSPSKLLFVFLILSILAWAVIALLVWRDGDAFAYTTFTAPLIYAMVLIKPPNLRWAFTAGDAFVVFLVLVSIASHVLHLTGIHSYPNAFPSRLPEIFWGLGLENRWEGPFASTSDSGPVGAFVLFYGFLRSGKLRTALVISGIIMLAVSTSWTSIYSALIGVVVLVWFVPQFLGVKLTSRFRAILTIFVSAVSVLYVMLFDPTFNGRVGIWLDYIDVWVANPLLGVGTSGLVEMHGAEIITHQHGHNYYIDILARHGMVGFLITIPVLIVGGVIAFKAGRRGLFAAPALFVVFCAAMIGETLVDWRSLGYVLMELLLMTLISASFMQTQRTGSPEVVHIG